MKNIKKLLFASICLLSILSSTSQTDVLKDDGLWFTMTNKFKITDKFYAGTFIQFRRVDFAKSAQFVFLCPYVGYNLTKNVSIGAGYTYVRVHANGAIHPAITKDENRLWQNITLSYKIGKTSFSNRLVIEERFKQSIAIENNKPIISGSTYAQRIRYRFNVSFNLFKLKGDKFILGKVSEEIRIRFENGFSNPDFDQNNFYVFAGYKFFDNFKLWLGYGFDHYKVNEEKYVANRIFHTHLSYDFDFRKSKK